MGHGVIGNGRRPGLAANRHIGNHGKVGHIGRNWRFFGFFGLLWFIANN
jgi:hypothetical protein